MKNFLLKKSLGMCLCMLACVSTNSFAQTCNSSVPATTPTSRFTILGNGSEIKDNQTGLIWQRCTIGQTWTGTTCAGSAVKINWRDGLKAANNLGNGYRMPNIRELRSIVERQCYETAVNSTIFPNTVSDGYWTSTPSSTTSQEAIKTIDFESGMPDAFLLNNLMFVRAVR